ncbi:CHASE2 domain-containing protein [Almyronema epifaneia]|uniref:non-specific serine/threonine protein kinase n=1 Tax=Almyronema epifaneia S1 TaxID=2991925 RepID=A0ABW6IEE4_9CYAN
MPESRQVDLKEGMQQTPLAGRYQIIRTLGAGGFGQTYVAEDLQQPQRNRCVVKQLQPASRDPKFLQVARRLFETEAKTLRRLGQHEGIPRLLDFFEAEEEFYLVQELIDGTPLSLEFKQSDRLTEAAAIELLREILEILQFVHKHHVIHRDIKPENIIRRRSDGKPVLIDFGAVKEINTQLATGQATTLTVGIGTQGYTPHEQLVGKPRYNSDLYALGMTIIYGLTGRLPADLLEHPQTAEAIWQDQTTISAGLKVLLSKMVRYSFYYRYQTAEDVLKDLDRLDSLAHEAITLHNGTLPWLESPEPLPRRLLKGLRHTAIASLASLSLILGIRQIGGFQPLELKFYDWLVQQQSRLVPDTRLLVVEITEADLRQLQRSTPSDQTIAQAINILQQHRPRTIGLDLHREIPQPPGHENLLKALQADNTIAITKIGNDPAETIPPPMAIPPERVGFNDFPVDADGVIRRNLLFASESDDPAAPVLYSFALRLALQYLKKEDIEPQAQPDQPDYMQLGAAVFYPLRSRSGGYQTVDDKGYQILLDYRTPAAVAPQLSLTQILNQDFEPSWVQDKAVLIGMTASSAKDLFYTPYSAIQSETVQMPGVIVHAQMVSQILSAAQGDRPLTRYWPEWAEILWIGGWTITAAALAGWLRHLWLLGTAGVGLVVVITGTSWWLFSQQVWLPVAAPVGAMLLAGGLMIVYRAYQKSSPPLSTMLVQPTLPYQDSHLTD